MNVQTGQAFGRYRVLRVLGRGGFATVFLALDPALQRQVAVKVLHEQWAADPTAAARFQDEARQLAQLRHPNIVVVHDVGEESGRPYFAMEYVQGQELGELLDARGTLALGDTVQVALQLGSALDYLHARGIVHRDLKPSNLMLSQDGRLVLMDFGIARALGQRGHTTAGTIMGTPAYMAPEQARGSAVSPATDVYAMAVLLYHCLGGKPPFEGDPLAVMHLQASEPPPPLAGRTTGLPPEVYAAVHAGLAKEPATRPASAGDLARALARAAGIRVGSGTLPFDGDRPPPPPAPAAPPPPASPAPSPAAWPQALAQPPKKRSKLPWLVAALALVAVAAGAATVLISRGSTDDSGGQGNAPPSAAAPATAPAPSPDRGGSGAGAADDASSPTPGAATGTPAPPSTRTPTATATPARPAVPPGDYRVVQNSGTERCLRARSGPGTGNAIYVCVLDGFVLRLTADPPQSANGYEWRNAEGLGWMAAQQNGGDTFLAVTAVPQPPRSTFSCLRLAFRGTPDGSVQPPAQLSSAVRFDGARFTATNNSFDGWLFADALYFQYHTGSGGDRRVGSVTARLSGTALAGGVYAATAFDPAAHGAYGDVSGGTTGC